MDNQLILRKFTVDHNKANYLILGGFFYTLPLIKEIIGTTRSIVITNKERQKEYNQETCKFNDSFDSINFHTYIDAIKRGKENGVRKEHTYLVFDDCFYDDSWQSNKALVELLRDPDNIFNTSVIIALSFPYLHNPYIYNCIDYTIVLHDVYKRDLELLYKRYFNFIRPYNLFKNLFDSLCCNRENCAVLVNGEIESTSLQRVLYFYVLPQ